MRPCSWRLLDTQVDTKIPTTTMSILVSTELIQAHGRAIFLPHLLPGHSFQFMPEGEYLQRDVVI